MFNDELKKARLRKQLSGRKTAELVGLSSPYYSQLETGKRGPPPHEVLERIDEVLQTKFAKSKTLADLPSEYDEEWRMAQRLAQPAYALSPRERVSQYAAVAYDAAKHRKKAGQFETLMQHVSGVVTQDDSYDWHRREISNIIDEHFRKENHE